MARLQLEAQEKELIRKADYDLRPQVLKLEIEAEKEVRLKQLEVEAMRITAGQAVTNTFDNAARSIHKQGFDVCKHISLVQTFRESEVDS